MILRFTKNYAGCKANYVGQKYIREYQLQGSFSLSVQMKLIKRMRPISSDKFRMYLNIFRKQTKIWRFGPTLSFISTNFIYTQFIFTL